MRWFLTPYAVPLVFSGASSALLAGYVWRRRATAPGAVWLAYLASAAAWYSLGYALEILAADLPAKIFWAKVQYLGLVSIAPLFLIFSLEYAGLGDRISRRGAVALAVVPAATVLLAATNEAHGLIWAHTEVQSVGPSLLLVLERGPAFWLFSAYSYALLFLSAGVFAHAALFGPGPYHRQGILLLAGMLVPLLANLGYAIGITPVPHLNPTPVVFSLSVAFIALGMFRFHLLDLVPVARQALVDRMHDGVLVVDSRGRVLDLNPALAAVIGRGVAQAIGKPVEEALAGWPELLQRLRGPSEVETEIALGEGVRRRDYALSIVPMLPLPGSPAGRLVVLRDITEIQRLEAQFRQAQKMETLGRLAGGVAHDFNNLLTAIKGYAALARDVLAPDNPARQDIERILRNAERGSQLTRQLLTFSRRQATSLRPLSINELLVDLESMLPQTFSENVEVVTLPAPDLGLVKVDPNQLQQVVINLVLNAVDAMPDGGRLTLRTANVSLVDGEAPGDADLTPGEYVVLAISDTGVGMSDEVKAHLFEPFFTTKDVGKGTGLGLATAFGIVRQHRGGIVVESDPGRGSTFRVFLPRAT